MKTKNIVYKEEILNFVDITKIVQQIYGICFYVFRSLLHMKMIPRRTAFIPCVNYSIFIYFILDILRDLGLKYPLF